MSVTQADYAIVLQQCRDAIRTGNHGTVDLVKCIGVLLNAAGASGMSSAADTLATKAAALKATIDAQFTILNAFGGGDAAATIVAAIATANTAIAADEAALETARLAEVAANPTPLALTGCVTTDG